MNVGFGSVTTGLSPCSQRASAPLLTERSAIRRSSFGGLRSDFDLRASDQTAVGRGMLGRDKFLGNIFKLVNGHNNPVLAQN